MSELLLEADWSKLPRTAAEARASGELYYFTSTPCKYGHVVPRRAKNNECYQCILDRSQKRSMAMREANKPARDAAARKREAERPAQKAAAAERRRQQERKRRLDKIQRAIEQAGNTDDGYALLAAIDRARTDPVKQREKTRARRARGLVGYVMQRLRTPPWLTDEERQQIDSFYPAPPGHHTDHIIPISHSLLAGLHVPGNLRHMKGRANIKKDNVFECTIGEAEDFVERGLAVWAFDVDDEGNIPWDRYPRPSPFG